MPQPIEPESDTPRPIRYVLVDGGGNRLYTEDFASREDAIDWLRQQAPNATEEEFARVYAVPLSEY